MVDLRTNASRAPTEISQLREEIELASAEACGTMGPYDRCEIAPRKMALNMGNWGYNSNHLHL